MFALFFHVNIFGIFEQSVLVNIARGPVVDTEALCDALQSGEIFAAGLDVFDPEPLPRDHRLNTQVLLHTSEVDESHMSHILLHRPVCARRALCTEKKIQNKLCYGHIHIYI